MKHSFWENFGIHIEIIVAGLLGGFLSLEDRAGLSTWEKLGVFASGGIISNYLTPAIVEWTDMNRNYMFGLAFLLGFSGLKGVKLLLIYLKKKFIKKD